MEIVAVIPARFASTRLPGKPLLSETGRPLIQHVVEAARKAARLERVIVATDDDRIAEAVKSFGGDCVMTRDDHPSGTDRVAEVARKLPHDVIVNVQGDEPELPGESIDLVVDLLEMHPEMVMATLATPIRSRDQLLDPSCVKVVFDQGAQGSGRALYFSRAPIPHAREWDDRLLAAEPAHYYQHIGLYAYRRDFLLQLATLPRTPLEKLENLEQLRVLEHGQQIAVGVVDERTIGIDTPADYRAFVTRHREHLRRAA